MASSDLTKMHYHSETKTHYDVFSYREFVNYAKTCDTNSVVDECRSKDSDEPFFGTSSFDEALGFAINGWEAGIKQVNDFIQTDGSKVIVDNNIAGHFVVG